MSDRYGPWQTVTIADNGTASSEVNLGAEFRDVQLYNPTMDNTTITIKPGRVASDTAVQAYTFGTNATGDFVNTTTTRTTAGMNVFKDICARYVTVVVASQAGGPRTLYARGIGLLGPNV